MQRIDGPSRTASFPAPAAQGEGAGAPGFFTGGDPLAGIQPTTVSADWLNAIQEELAAVIEFPGITLDKAAHNQLLTAIISIIDQRIAASRGV